MTKTFTGVISNPLKTNALPIFSVWNAYRRITFCDFEFGSLEFVWILVLDAWNLLDAKWI